jgi:hypothetical protein
LEGSLAAAGGKIVDGHVGLKGEWGVYEKGEWNMMECSRTPNVVV